MAINHFALPCHISDLHKADSQTPAGHHHTDPMDMNAITIGAFGQASPPVSPKLPMSILQRARSISLERRQQYCNEGRCVRYGSEEHWVKDCNLSPFSLRSRSRSRLKQVEPHCRCYRSRGHWPKDYNVKQVQKVGPSRVVIAAINDDEYDKYDNSEEDTPENTDILVSQRGDIYKLRHS
jgi:hypothetical protein